MNSARIIRKGGQIDRREIARTPKEAQANMDIPDLVTVYRERAKEQAMKKSASQTPEEPRKKRSTKAKLPVTEERSDKQNTDTEAASESPQDAPVRVKYEGRAGKFRIAGYAFRPGQIREVTHEASLEILTYPFERFTLVKE